MREAAFKIPTMDDAITATKDSGGRHHKGNLQWRQCTAGIMMDCDMEKG